MESRKLISFGSSSYVISLPKNWVDSNKLEKGDSIYIEEKPNELVITTDSSEKEKQIREKQIDASNKSLKRLQSEIAVAYLTTYDIIEIRNIPSHDISQVKDVLQNFAGLEILEQTANKIVARDLINVNEVSIKTLIRRIDIILRSMIDDVIECFKDCSKIKSSQLDERDKDINRLTFLVSRMAIASLKDPKLAKKFNTNPIEIMTELDLANRLERLGDNVKRLVRHVEQAKDDKQYSEITEIFKALREKYLVLMKAYYSDDMQTAFDIETSSHQIFDRCESLFVNGPSRHTFTLIIKLKNLATSIRYASRAIITKNS